VGDFPAGLDKAKAILEDAGYSVEGGRLHYPDGTKETLGQ
jgi:peptide/nickel transport system substrate-binding protein